MLFSIHKTGENQIRFFSLYLIHHHTRSFKSQDVPKLQPRKTESESNNIASLKQRFRGNVYAMTFINS